MSGFSFSFFFSRRGRRLACAPPNRFFSQVQSPMVPSLHPYGQCAPLAKAAAHTIFDRSGVTLESHRQYIAQALLQGGRHMARERQHGAAVLDVSLDHSRWQPRFTNDVFRLLHERRRWLALDDAQLTVHDVQDEPRPRLGRVEQTGSDRTGHCENQNRIHACIPTESLELIASLAFFLWRKYSIGVPRSPK